jgi:hypothetical protein
MVFKRSVFAQQLGEKIKKKKKKKKGLWNTGPHLMQTKIDILILGVCILLRV